MGIKQVFAGSVTVPLIFVAMLTASEKLIIEDGKISNTR